VLVLVLVLLLLPTPVHELTAQALRTAPRYSRGLRGHSASGRQGI
jgi:hypothetical protein